MRILVPSLVSLASRGAKRTQPKIFVFSPGSLFPLFFALLRLMRVSVDLFSGFSGS